MKLKWGTDRRTRTFDESRWVRSNFQITPTCRAGAALQRDPDRTMQGATWCPVAFSRAKVRALPWGGEVLATTQAVASLPRE